MVDSPLCFLCNEVEDYSHFFLTCRYVNFFWLNVNSTLKECGISKQINQLDYLVVGYKTDTHKYNMINTILSLIGYTVYKTYFLSNKRNKSINMWKHLLNELNITLYYLNIKRVNTSILRKFIRNMEEK